MTAVLVVNERLFNITLRHKLVKKSMDVNEHERLFNVTLRRKLVRTFFFFINLCLSVTLNSLSCSLTSIPFLTKFVSKRNVE
jgi:hypothetical protein